MINHVRTLLRNTTGSASVYPGDEYVPATFTAKTLPGWLSSLWRILFNGNPDAVMLNLRLQQYLTFIHSTELNGYAVVVDPRLTYWPFSTALMDRLLLGRTINESSGLGKQLSVVGSQFPETHESRLRQYWDVSVVDATTVSISYPDESGSLKTATASYTTTDGSSSLVSLPNSSLSVRFQTGGTPRWQIEQLCLPTYGPQDAIPQLETTLVGDTKAKLFDGNQFYVDLRDVWDKSAILPYRLGAVALAVAHRIGEQP